MLSTFNYGDALLVNKMAGTYFYNDVIYFEYPQSDNDSLPVKTFLFQRVVAAPGDTFQLTDKMIALNNIRMNDDSTCRHNYFIKTQNVKLDSAFRMHYKLWEGGEISDEFDYSYALTRSESARLEKDSLIKSIALKTEKTNTFDGTCFPHSPHYNWNSDQYGKLYIPKINDTLRLDTVSIHLYRSVISTYEKNKLDIKHDSIFINDRLASTYVVKKNYYFVMGDNRDNANDSRSWGFLPENFIVGKVIGTIRKTKP